MTDQVLSVSITFNYVECKVLGENRGRREPVFLTIFRKFPQNFRRDPPENVRCTTPDQRLLNDIGAKPLGCIAWEGTGAKV